MAFFRYLPCIIWSIKVYDIITDINLYFQVRQFPKQLDKWGAPDDGTCGDDPCGEDNMPVAYYAVLYTIVVVTAIGVGLFISEIINECPRREDDPARKKRRLNIKKWGLFFEDGPQLGIQAAILLGLNYWKDYAELFSDDNVFNDRNLDALVDDESFAMEWDFECSPECNEEVVGYYKGLVISLFCSFAGTILSIMTVIYLWCDLSFAKMRLRRGSPLPTREPR